MTRLVHTIQRNPPPHQNSLCNNGRTLLPKTGEEATCGKCKLIMQEVIEMLHPKLTHVKLECKHFSAQKGQGSQHGRMARTTGPRMSQEIQRKFFCS